MAKTTHKPKFEIELEVNRGLHKPQAHPQSQDQPRRSFANPAQSFRENPMDWIGSAVLLGAVGMVVVAFAATIVKGVLLSP